MKTKILSKGQALVEVMVAVSVLTVGFLGVISLLSRALSLNRVVADNYTATYLAAEGIEITKNVVDHNAKEGQPWNLALSDSSCPNGYEADPTRARLQCYTDQPLAFDSATGLYGYGSGAPTSFKRHISIVLLGQSEIQVNSDVTWATRGGGTSEINLEDHFFNWH